MSATEAEERAQFTLTMRARGINDLRLLRALGERPAARELTVEKPGFRLSLRGQGAVRQ